MIAGLFLMLLGVGLLWDDGMLRMLGASPRRWQAPVALLAVVLGVGLFAMEVAHASTPAASPVSATRVRIPDASAMYRRWVEQAVAEEWGVDGSPARLAAQLHQESSWDPHARSPAGAEGLAQFMPSTGRWIAQQFPRRLGDFDPWNPQQAALAAAVYDAWLATRNPGANACSTWAFALSAYNGGERNLRNEQAMAASARRDRRRWFGQVADMRARSTGAWRENRAYVKRILVELEPAYIDAGWSGQAVCA